MIRPMRVFYRVLLGFFVATILIGALFVFYRDESGPEVLPQQGTPTPQKQQKIAVPIPVPPAVTTSSDVGVEEEKTFLIAGVVPFSPQAPFGDWTDLRQQDACEETIALMAVSWARGETFTRAEALQKIIEISDWELAKYGEFRDTSTDDMVSWIFRDYFQFDGVHTEYDVTAEDLIRELQKGNILGVPVAGRALKNPFFTLPGPLNHMVLVIGYDEASREFIVHDPGTKQGENFRYDRLVLENAMRDYPTGAYGTAENPRKVMMVIEKS